MKELHSTQKKLLKLLRKTIENPLTVLELAEELDISSTSVVHHHIQQLERKGYLKRNPSNPRDYQILQDPENPIVYINQYGLAQCGSDGSILDGNPVDRIPIASRLIKFPATEAFIVVAKGDSMKPEINAGDIVIAQKQKTAQTKSGDIVVCVNNEKAIIKKIVKSKGDIILQSINVDHPPFAAAEDFRVEGVVRNIIKYS